MAACVIAAAVAAVMLYGPGDRAAAQGEPSPYHFRSSPERIRAIVEAAKNRLPYIPGEVLVKFRAGTSAAGMNRALLAVRSRPSTSVLRWAGGVAVLRDRAEPDPRVLAAQLRRQPEVLYAEPNRLHRPLVAPDDPGFDAQQWNLKAIDMPRAWDINAGASSNIIVAVVDTGVTTINQTLPFQTWTGSQIQTRNIPFATNPDLSASRLLPGTDLVFWDGPVLDLVGHGTHVSATIGEDANNGFAEAGIAFNVRIMPVKVCFGFWDVQFSLSGLGQPGFAPLDFEGCPDDAIAEGIRFAADNGAKVINLSLGSSEPSQTLTDALKYAVTKGAFIAIAAGNSFEEGNPAEFPASDAADIEGAMSVGAVGRSLTRAFYSGTASKTEIAAPGGNIRDGGPSGLIWQMSLLEDDFEPEFVLFPSFNRYIEVGKMGTSMAAPHVAAVAALIMSQGVTKPAAVESALRGSARDLGAKGKDNDFGAGLVQPREALRGFGFVTK